MSHWNYRVIEFNDGAEPWYAIHEVYYDDAGEPNGYSAKPAIVIGSNIDGDRDSLRWTLDRMHEALDQPVLHEADFEPDAGIPVITSN